VNEKILFVDDEVGLLEMLKMHFNKNGFNNLSFAKNGEEALNLFRRESFDLVVLDIMLPDIDGFELCRLFRRDSFIPILFLTARTTDMDKITGLTIGGDDYITKPFNPLEVLARTSALLRRQKFAQEALTQQKAIYDFGHFQLNKNEAKLIINHQEVSCPLKEFELLEFFCEHPNQIFSTQHLHEKVWGDMSLGNENTVMVHIRRLRQKIEKDPSNPKYLVNVRGFGYKFVK
jgi:two-component system, OmpR family, response regulator RegX3